MQVFEVVIALLVLGAALSAVSRRIGAPYPALVALAGATLALVPGVPTLTLDPELALVLFVAPVLLDAAFDSSPRDMRANWRAISSLALGAVVLTIAAVAIVARALVPELPWSAAIALGAIVAPPDAAAATTVLKALRPPHRLMVILEGESLFNDASALLVYRLAVGTTVVGTIAGWSVIPTLLIVTVGSVALALVLSRVISYFNRLIRDVPTAVIFQFAWTFGVWMLAEQLHLSGIITMVVFAIAVARRAGETIPARMRIPSFAVWEVAVFVLNVLAFILVGFQLRSIAGRVSVGTGAWYALIAAVICVAVILARVVWVAFAVWFYRWRQRVWARLGHPMKNPLVIENKPIAVVMWCGMRGTVTLATALALPVDFPERDLLLVVAFGVVLGTLVLQGLTLRPLMMRLKLEDDGTVEREVQVAREETLRAAIAVASACPDTETAALVKHRYELQLRHEQGQELEAEVVREANEAQRKKLMALRAEGIIGDAAFLRVEEELDWAELDWERLVGEREPPTAQAQAATNDATASGPAPPSGT